nr:NDP-sugar synthase [Candidatus Sigynarchaeota archaeon]
MNAIILAGGYGTRLRPITCSIPKPMLPVVNKPLLNFIISKLMQETPGLKKIVIAVNYRAHDIDAYMKEWQKAVSCEIHVQDERKPLGTGGALKFSQKLLEDDSFFMLNGDVVSYFSYKDMLAQHKKTKAVATISAIRVPDVSRYGVLVSDRNDTIIREFYEKPKTTELIKKYSSYPVNAGTYLLEPAIFDYITPEKKVSIEKDVFPHVAKKRMAHKFEFSGIWKDFGLPEEYLAGNFIILEEETRRLGAENIMHPSVKLGKGTIIKAPVCFDENVTIGDKCVIGPHVVLGKDCEVGDNVKLSESVFLENCSIDDDNDIIKVIMGDGVNTGTNVQLIGPAILGSNVYIEDQVMLKAMANQTVKVCPWVTITAESVEHSGSNGAFIH